MIEMDGRDREPYYRSDERPPRLRSSATSQGRRGPTAGFGRFDDDLELSDDPPSWEDRFGSGRDREPNSQRTVDRQSRREPESPYSSAGYRSRSTRYDEDVIDHRPTDEVADPYDRLRRVSERRSRRVDDDILQAGLTVGDVIGQPAPVRQRPERRMRAGEHVARAPRPPLAQPQLRAVGSMLVRSSEDAGALAKPASAALVSLLALGIFTLLRIGSVDDWLVVRVDAAGEPTRWASNETLWRVPMLVMFATVAGLLVAWRLRRHDAFAAQFTILAVLLLHGIGWVAAGRLLL